MPKIRDFPAFLAVTLRSGGTRNVPFGTTEEAFAKLEEFRALQPDDLFALPDIDSSLPFLVIVRSEIVMVEVKLTWSGKEQFRLPPDENTFDVRPLTPVASPRKAVVMPATGFQPGHYGN